MVAKLVVLKGKAQGREIPLPATQFIIGRGSKCHLRPHSGLVSKMHCAIARQPGGGVVVRDLKSRNRTYVNDTAIKGTVRVADGDVLAVGPLLFQFAINLKETGSSLQYIADENRHWLLEDEEASREVVSLDSSAETAVIDVPPHLLEENGRSGNGNGAGERSLTVGKYLREYYRSRRNGNLPDETSVEVELRAEQIHFVDHVLARICRNNPEATRNGVVQMIIDAVAAQGLDLSEIQHPDDLKRILGRTAEKL